MNSTEIINHKNDNPSTKPNQLTSQTAFAGRSMQVIEDLAIWKDAFQNHNDSFLLHENCLPGYMLAKIFKYLDERSSASLNLVSKRCNYLTYTLTKPRILDFTRSNSRRYEIYDINNLDDIVLEKNSLKRFSCRKILKILKAYKSNGSEIREINLSGALLDSHLCTFRLEAKDKNKVKINKEIKINNEIL